MTNYYEYTLKSYEYDDMSDLEGEFCYEAAEHNFEKRRKHELNNAIN